MMPSVDASLLKALYLLERTINAILAEHPNAEVISVSRSLLKDAAKAVNLAYSLATDEKEMEGAAEKLGWVRLPPKHRDAVDAGFWLIQEVRKLRKKEDGL